MLYLSKKRSQKTKLSFLGIATVRPPITQRFDLSFGLMDQEPARSSERSDEVESVEVPLRQGCR